LGEVGGAEAETRAAVDIEWKWKDGRSSNEKKRGRWGEEEPNDGNRRQGAIVIEGWKRKKDKKEREEERKRKNARKKWRCC